MLNATPHQLRHRAWLERIPPTLFFVGTCALIALMAQLTFRRWFHWRNAWGGVFLTLGIWWLVAASRQLPSRAEAKVLGPRGTRRLAWDAYRATLWPTLRVVVPTFLVIALLYRVAIFS